MNYIATKRARFMSLSGKVNLPYGTEVESENGVLMLNGAPLCADHSQNAHDYFSRNDDGRGLERGKLVHAIMKSLSARDKQHQERWNMVWEDETCQKYKRAERANYWLWNHDFFNAPIHDLKHIADLVGAKEV